MPNPNPTPNPIETKWKPPVLRLTFSNWDTKSDPNLKAPWLSFILTIEFRHPHAPAAEFFYQHTVPGCLYNPFLKGVNGSYGQFRPPRSFSRQGNTVNSVIIAPDSITASIEAAIKKHDEILIWTKKLEAEYFNLGIDPKNENQMRRFKKALGRKRAQSMKSSSR